MPRADVHRGERGSVVAEFAVAMPAVLLVLALLLGGVQLGATAVRLQDAAADAARGLARGDGPSAVQGRLAAQVPGASLRRRVVDGLECVTVSAGPPGVAALAGIRLDASSCALPGGT